MHDRPHARELLETLAEMLENDVLPATEGLVQHHARVGASLCAILMRELALGDEIEAKEKERLQELLASETPSLASLNQSLDLCLAYCRDETFARNAWQTLLATTRNKLRVTKPGHDDFDFSDELSR